MPVAATFRRISSGLGSGTGTSSIRSGSLYPYILAARMFMSSPPSRVTGNGLARSLGKCPAPSLCPRARPATDVLVAKQAGGGGNAGVGGRSGDTTALGLQDRGDLYTAPPSGRHDARSEDTRDQWALQVHRARLGLRTVLLLSLIQCAEHAPHSG